MIRIVIAPVVLFVLASAVQAAGDPLDEALFEKAGSILPALKAKGYKNVGVVKFMVRKGDGPTQDDVGDLNQTLANKLEVALILANTDEKFGIIEKATEAVRGKLPPANHLSEEGRKAFFVRKYDLGWSTDKVDASGFLTGVAAFSADFARLTVKIQVFDRTGQLTDLSNDITLTPSPEMLAQAGFSYTISAERRKTLVAGDPPPPRETVQKEIIQQVAAEQKALVTGKSEEAFAPLTECPIKWKILYNGKTVAVNGNRVPEPNTTDKVEFELSNPSDATYAAVLLVNGDNTLYQERSAPAACRKWVLPPGATVLVRGFQTDANTAAPFSVLPPQAPIPDAVRYGDHAGTYRLAVFHGRMSNDEPSREDVARFDPKDANTVAIARTRGGTRPAGVKPQSLKALQADLRGRLGGGSARGYVVKGSTAETNETTSVHFVMSSDTPVADISLRYAAAKKD